MLLGTFKAIASLCVIFHTRVCSATKGSLYHEQMEDDPFPTSRGFNLLSARCGQYLYDKQTIYGTVDEAMLSLPYLLKADAIAEESVTYVPSKNENMRFKPPYYFYLIVRDQPSPINDDQKDYVIITKNGRLAKVVSQIRYPIQEAPGYAWRKQDCILEYGKAPRARERKLRVIN